MILTEEKTMVVEGAQAVDKNSSVVPGVLRPKSGSTQKLATTASSTAFATDAVVRIVADGACHYLLGTAPTADANDHYLPANTIELIKVDAGDKINVLGANLYVDLME